MSELLRAETDFVRLREPVWRRFHGRHPVYTRDRFDEAYAEWWTRELERHAAGRASRPAAPVAFVAEAVHRVLIDESRSRARGLSRGEEKQGLELVELEAQGEVAGDADATISGARYQLIVHRILDLVREQLSARELRVFVHSYLYLQTTTATAEALGMSLPRVKKDRKRIATKVGEEVWGIVGGELDLCSVYDERQLPAVLELLTSHVDECPRCREALRGLRGGAHAVCGPMELLAAGGATTGIVGLWDGLVTRLSSLVHRVGELTTSVPPGGRTAAAVTAVAAAAVGGGVAVEQAAPDRRPAAAPSRRAPSGRAARVPPAAPTALRPAAAAPAVTAAPAPPRRSSRPSRRRVAPRAVPTAVPAATAAPAVTSAPRPTSRPPSASPPPTAPPPPSAPPSQPSGGSEFGFEQG